MIVLKPALIAAMTLTLIGCGGGDSGKAVQTAEAGGKKVTLSTATGQLTNGDNAFTLTFTDASGQPVAVEAPAVRFTMPAEGTMAEMNADARVAPSGKPGGYKGTVDLGMRGPWQTAISFRDANGQHKATFTIQAQ